MLRRCSIVLALCVPLANASAQTYAVGRTSATWNDPAQGGKSIPVDIFYPATASGTGTPVAGPAGQKYPVLVFGHGYQISTTAYEYLANALVPDGYFFVLPKTGAELFPSHAAFAKDMVFCATNMQALGQTPTSPFHEHVASSACALGHSMGGGASFLALQQSSVFSALATLAPAETNPSAIAAAASLARPALIVAGGSDCVTPLAQHAQPLYGALAGTCKALVVLQGGSHCQFATQSFTCSLGELFCSTGISSSQQQAHVVALLRPWLGSQLGQQAGAWTQFKGLATGTSGFTTQLACVTTPSIAATTGLYSAASGSALLGGDWLDLVTQVDVGGVSTPFQALTKQSLQLQLDPQAPGAYALALAGSGGNALLDPGVLRWPALSVGTLKLGTSVPATLTLGTPGSGVLAWSPGAFAGLAIPGIDYLLQLSQPFLLGAAAAPAGTANFSITLPGDPGLAGVPVWLQTYAAATGSGGGWQSFSNAHAAVLQL